MKWLIGVDLRETATGALHFASWLARVLPEAKPTLLPVHVLEESYLLQVLRHTHIDAVETLALAGTVAQLDRVGIGGLAAPARVVRGIEASDTLVREFDAEHADALVIGRQAQSTDRRIVRLGRIARRLVRRLPCPIVVVPPDLRLDAIGGGPIVLATDLDETSGSAAKFALRLAAATGRPIVVANVVGDDGEASRMLPTESNAELLAQLGLERQAELTAWMNRHGLGGMRSIVAYGDVLGRLTSILAAEGAPLAVCGSRGLGAVERVFIASVGTDLACWAGCAVAIVPPTWGA
jgi:nucleotide-binding universal stress UspA family protein